VDYILVRSGRRKTVGFVVEDDGILRVRAPEGLSQERIDEMIDAKRSWIRSSLAKWRKFQDARVDRVYEEGARFPYLGRNYQLTPVEDATELSLRNGRFAMPKTFFDAGPEAMQQEFQRFYTWRLQTKLAALVSRYAPLLGVEPAAVRVLDLKSRWGSCSKKENINFHWKCCMLPTSVLSYVVAHEIAHLLVADHSPAFWSELQAVMPEYRQHHDWLAEHGGGMSL